MTIRQSFRFFTVIFILFVATALISCGSGSESSEENGKLSHQGTNLGVSFTAPKFLRSAGNINFQCHAKLDGGDPVPLTVNEDNTVSGTIPNVQADTYDLELTYFTPIAGNNIVLCTYSSSITVNAGQTTTVSIPDNKLNRNHDSDYDGYTNLAEVRIGTNALDSSSFPISESPRVLCVNGVADAAASEDYTAAVVVGSPLAGTAVSADYKFKVSDTGW